MEKLKNKNLKSQSGGGRNIFYKKSVKTKISPLSGILSPLRGERGYSKAFTLVELIVVITILAVLSAIGFVAFSGYLAGTRDTNRISQLKSISDGLELYRTKHDLPIPEDKVEINASGTVIAYQGYVGKNVLETIEYSSEGVDPKDGTYFSYYLTKDKKYYQLMAFLEEADNLQNTKVAFSPFFKGSTPKRGGINKAYALDYTNRYPTVYGKKLGILTDTENTPIQEIEDIKTNGLDIVNTNSGFIARFTDASEDKIEGTGAVLVQINPKASCKRIKELKGGAQDGVYTINPTGDNPFKVYCDMTTDGGGWTLVNKTYLDNTNPGRKINGIDQGWINLDMNISKILDPSVKTDGILAVAGHKLSKFDNLLNKNYIMRYEFISADGGTEKRTGFVFSNNKNVFLGWQVDTPVFKFCDSLNKDNCSDIAKWNNGGNSGGATGLSGSNILDSRFSSAALHYRYNGAYQSICSSTGNSSWWPDNGYDSHWGNGQRTWLRER